MSATRPAAAIATMVRTSFIWSIPSVRCRESPVHRSVCDTGRGTAHESLTAAAVPDHAAGQVSRHGRPGRMTAHSSWLSCRPATAHARATQPDGIEGEVTGPTGGARGCRPRTRPAARPSWPDRKPGAFSSVTGQPDRRPCRRGPSSRTSPSVPSEATNPSTWTTSMTNPADTSRGGATGASVRPSRKRSRPSSPPTTRTSSAQPRAVACCAVAERLASARDATSSPVSDIDQDDVGVTGHCCGAAVRRSPAPRPRGRPMPPGSAARPTTLPSRRSTTTTPPKPLTTAREPSGVTTDADRRPRRHDAVHELAGASGPRPRGRPRSSTSPSASNSLTAATATLPSPAIATDHGWHWHPCGIGSGSDATPVTGSTRCARLRSVLDVVEGHRSRAVDGRPAPRRGSSRGRRTTAGLRSRPASRPTAGRRGRRPRAPGCRGPTEDRCHHRAAVGARTPEQPSRAVTDLDDLAGPDREGRPSAVQSTPLSNERTVISSPTGGNVPESRSRSRWSGRDLSGSAPGRRGVRRSDGEVHSGGPRPGLHHVPDVEWRLVAHPSVGPRSQPTCGWPGPRAPWLWQGSPFGAHGDRWVGVSTTTRPRRAQASGGGGAVGPTSGQVLAVQAPRVRSGRGPIGGPGYRPVVPTRDQEPRAAPPSSEDVSVVGRLAGPVSAPAASVEGHDARVVLGDRHLLRPAWLRRPEVGSLAASQVQQVRCAAQQGEQGAVSLGAWLGADGLDRLEQGQVAVLLVEGGGGEPAGVRAMLPLAAVQPA